MRTIEQLIAEEIEEMAREEATLVQNVLYGLKKLYGDELFYALNIDKHFSFTYKDRRYQLQMVDGSWFIKNYTVDSRRLMLKFLATL